MLNKKRFRNYGLWMAVSSFLLLLLHNFGVPIVTESYYELWNGFLGLLVLLGIISNPTKPGSGSGGFNL